MHSRINGYSFILINSFNDDANHIASIEYTLTKKTVKNAHGKFRSLGKQKFLDDIVKKNHILVMHHAIIFCNCE